jgi:3-phenylpropionate/cinnamic acid dioxygenase small subunit
MNNMHSFARSSDGPMVFAPADVEAFVLTEAAILDERRFRDWMDLFADDATYWVPAVPDQDSPFNQASLFYDDRDLMKTRVGRLGHPKIHIQNPASRTVHQIGRITIVAQPEGGCKDMVVTSSFMMVEYRQDRQRIFAGRQFHRLRAEGASFRIAHKRVDLVNSDAPFEPIAVPF